jgi:hypothetical protein
VKWRLAYLKVMYALLVVATLVLAAGAEFKWR